MSRARQSVLAWVLLVSLVAGPVLAMEPPHVSAAEQGWELMRDENGIRSYKRIVPGSPLLAFRGEAAIDAPIDRVMSVLQQELRRSWEYHGKSVLVAKFLPGDVRGGP